MAVTEIKWQNNIFEGGRVFLHSIISTRRLLPLETYQIRSGGVIVFLFLFCFGGLSLLSFCAFAQPPNAEADGRAQGAATTMRDFPILAQRVKVQQAADFVIALDASGSMRPFWPTVQQGLAAFIEAIPDGDYLSLITFGTQASYSATPSLINASTRADFVAAASRLSTPTDKNTDLGRAVEKAIGELNRPSGNRLKFVFFLSDFKHDPSKDSSYSGKISTADAVWQRLAQRRQNEQQGNILQVFALLLPLGRGVGRDIPLVKTVFPELEQVRVNRSTLLPWFERRKAEIARDKLRLIVESDAQKLPFQVKGIRQRRGLLYAVIDTNGHQIVEMVAIPSLKIIEASGDANLGAKFQITPLSDPSKFEPKLQVREAIPHSGEQMEIPVAQITSKQRTLIRSFTSGKIAITLEGTQSLAPSNELAKLNLAAERPFVLRVDIPTNIHRGYVPLWLLLTVVCLLLVGLGLWLYSIRPEYIVGEITVIGQLPRNIAKSAKRKTFLIGSVQPEEGMELSGVQWRLMMQALRKPRGVHVKMERGSGKLNNQEPITTLKWVKLPQDSQIEIGEKNIRLHLRK